ncbi:MAG: hypothetical protein Q8Q91_01975, partial [Candidatus Daviesbacteria bacterium]|nr:hypothetical protein [Candidatus Daviesbacteria bacterium]
TFFRVAVISNHLPFPGDGQKAAEFIRRHRPEAVIISYATPTQTFGDTNVYKGDAPEVLLDAIKNA